MAERSGMGYRDIAAALREQMLADWQPGKKLPTYAEMREQFATTPVTMQRAMDLLVEQGFVITRPTVGSFYAEHRPDECQVGLVFPGHPSEIVNFGWSLNYLASMTVAKAINAQQGRWRFRFYMDLSREAGSKGLAKLQHDIENHVLAGVIWNYSPHNLGSLPLLKEPLVPMVHYNPDFMPEVPALRLRVQLEEPGLECGLKWMLQRDRTEVAVLMAAHHKQFSTATAYEKLGLPYRPEWVLPIDVYKPQWVGNLLASFFREDGRRRPQGLIITDDHLVEPTVRALKELAPFGLDELAIFAHWNFPLPYRGTLPIARHGYDATAWIATALEMIAACPTVSHVASHPERTVVSKLVEGASTSPANSASFTQLIHSAKEELQCVTQ